MSNINPSTISIIDVPETDNYSSEMAGTVSPVVDAAVVDGVDGASTLPVPSSLQPSPPSAISLPLTSAQDAEDAREGALARTRGTGTELTHNEKETILALYYERKLTQVEIAKALNVHQSTVSRTLARYRDSTSLAKRRLRARAEEILEKAVDIALENGEVKELLRLLKGVKTPEGVRVVEADREFVTGKGKDVGPNVFVGVKIENVK